MAAVDDLIANGFEGRDLVFCTDGPRAGAWYFLDWWTEQRRLADWGNETPSTGSTLGYVATREMDPLPVRSAAFGSHRRTRPWTAPFLGCGVVTAAPAGRRIPGRASTCGRCGAPIVWARTAAAESGTGGKAMPLDPVEDPAGNVAVRPMNDRGALVARVLAGDDTLDTTVELRAMPHFATCKPPDPQLPLEPPANVVDFAAARAARRHQSGRRP